MDTLYTILFMLFALVMWCCYIYLNRRVEMLEAEKVIMRNRIDELESKLDEQACMYDYDTTDDDYRKPFYD